MCGKIRVEAAVVVSDESVCASLCYSLNKLCLNIFTGMKPENVNSVMLVGASNANLSTFLFQCANYWSEQGEKVLYMSPTPISKLPPGIHGMPKPVAESVSQIRFLYLPRWQDLLKHLYSIHQYGYIPRVIIVEGLNLYCVTSSGESRTSSEKYEAEVHSAMVCAALIDASAVCARRLNKSSALVVSYDYTSGQEGRISMLIDTFFSDCVWFVECLKCQETEDCHGDEVVVASSVACPGHDSKVKVEFVPRKCDDSLILHKIIHYARVTESGSDIDKSS